MTLLHVIRHTHKMFNTSKSGGTHSHTQNMIYTDVYPHTDSHTNLRHLCGLLRPTMLNSSRLSASHNPLCLQDCDVSDASWFSGLLWSSDCWRPSFQQQWQTVLSTALILGFYDLMVWLFQGQVNVDEVVMWAWIKWCNTNIHLDFCVCV